ncbi:MAG: LruC domain-containing protein [Cyclobacteriaceae bacterium]
MKNTIYIIALFLLCQACMERIGDEAKGTSEPIEIPQDFEFNTTTQEQILIELQTSNQEPMKSVMIRFWSDLPENNGEIFLKMVTDSFGKAKTNYHLNTASNSIVVEILSVGFPQWTQVTRDQVAEGLLYKGFDHSYSELSIGQSILQSQSSTSHEPSSGRITQASISALGTYNGSGVPDYLEPRDEITAELLAFINASLPESKPVPIYHPRFIADNSQTNLDILQTADVWMTFVHEGAGYRNTVGFYTYETGNPPQTKADITEIKVAFPNVSFNNSGGGLTSGDKVNLGRFEPGISIGFVLFANGWNGSITTGIRQVYSHEYLNPETDPDLQAHNVLLWDDTNELFLLGFEDLNRMEGSDDDFNDAIFYLTSNPVEGISTENVNPIDKPQDTDGDGVNDTYDEFPNDPKYAYRYSYPGESSFGTFAFEDNWPGFGDYDFNDLVVDYQYHQFANATNKMVELRPKFVIKAVGAGFNNAFGIELDISPSKIRSISGSQLSTGLFNMSSNGTESGQTNAVVIATDQAHRNFNTRGFVNTDPTLESHTPDTISLVIQFNNPIDLSATGSAPFNPFIVINQTRGREAHLPGYNPTDLVDTSLFGTGNDASAPSRDVYYKSQTGLPWAMNLPVSFDYPVEKTSILNGYNHFNQWAKSSGFSYMDWYQNKAGFRNSDKLYSR